MTGAIAVASVETTVAALEETHPGLAAMIRGLAVEASFAETNGDAETFVLNIMEGILSAESEDEIFEAQEAGGTSGKDFANRPFTVNDSGIVWRISNIENDKGFPFYAMMTVTEIATGEEVTLTCGGKTFVCVLRALQMKGALKEPKPLVIISTPSPNGAFLSLRPYRVAKTTGKRGK